MYVCIYIYIYSLYLHFIDYLTMIYNIRLRLSFSLLFIDNLHLLPILFYFSY